METIFSITNLHRKPKYQISTRAYLGPEGSKVFRKVAVSKEANQHIKNIYQNHLQLSRATKDSKIKIIAPIDIDKESSWVDFEEVEGKTLERILLKKILDLKFSEIEQIVKDLKSNIEELQKLAKKVPNNLSLSPEGSKDSAILDINFDNLILNNSGELIMIDCEWIVDEAQIGSSLILSRAFYYLLSRSNEVIKQHHKRIKLLVDEKGVPIPKKLLDLNIINQEELGRALTIDDLVQKDINLIEPSTQDARHLKLKEFKPDPVTGDIPAMDSRIKHLEVALQLEKRHYEVDYAALSSSIEDKERHIKNLESKNKDLEKENQHLKKIIHNPIKYGQAFSSYAYNKIKKHS
jgi:hypothetical protein